MGNFPSVGEVVSSSAAIRGGSTGRVYIIRSAEPIASVIETCYRAAPLLPQGVHLTLDEGVMLTSGAEPGKLKRQLREIIATARHRRLRLTIIAQAANFLDYQTLALADRLDLFAVTDRWNQEKIRSAGVPQEITLKLSSLPDHQYFSGAPGRPKEEWHGPWATSLPRATAA
jgi:hypothetical protein